MTLEPGCPAPQGLYDPSQEKDACGVGFVVHVKGVRSHAIVRQALQLLVNLLHRGACGCEVNTGDGAGILIQMPDEFLRQELRGLGIALPQPGEYGAGCVFLPRDPSARETIEALIETIVQEEGQTLLGWRDLPTDDRLVGASAAAVEPYFKQIFIGSRLTKKENSGSDPQITPFERKLYASGSSTRSTSCRSRARRRNISTSRACRRTR
jgi:glutamate synthase (NADPH) large chain